jgi:hypothetical protein
LLLVVVAVVVPMEAPVVVVVNYAQMQHKALPLARQQT